MFDSKAVRNKSELRSCSWTVPSWKLAISLLCLCSEFISYYNLHHKHFCIKCFCCFEVRKAQKHIYCQRRRQFNYFQNRVCYMQWSEYCCFHCLIKHFWKFKLHWSHDNCAQLRRFFNYITLILIIHNNTTNDKNVDLTRNMFKINFNHDRRQWLIVFFKSNERKQQIICIHLYHWRCIKIFSFLMYIKSMIYFFWYSVFFFTVCVKFSIWI